MSSKQGGKQKPLTAPKREKKELDEDDIAFQKKQAEEKKKMSALANAVKTKGGPLSQGGIKKS